MKEQNLKETAAKLVSKISEQVDIIVKLRDEVQDSYDNLSESSQDEDTGQEYLEVIEHLETALVSLGEAMDELKSI